MSTCERAPDEYMNTLGVDLKSVDVPPTDPGIDAAEQLKTLINTIKPKYYHTDSWQLDEANRTLTPIHKRPRRTKFMPDRSDCPVETDRLTGTRITTMDFGAGRIETVTEYFRQLANQNERTRNTRKERLLFNSRFLFRC